MGRKLGNNVRLMLASAPVLLLACVQAPLGCLTFHC